MTNKNIYIISESFSLEDNNKLLNKKNMSINYIRVIKVLPHGFK